MLQLKTLLVFCCCVAFALAADDETSENGFMVEGDILLSKRQIENRLNGGSSNSFSIAASDWQKWPGGIVPYTFAKDIKKTWWRESSIEEAMRKWEEKTCIKFVPRTHQKAYIEFFADFGKCYSNVGRQGAKQRLSLGFGCFGLGTAIHEIGHALGMWHEQSRPDRDEHVEIIWDNIQEGHSHNFDKHYDVNSLGSPYDFDSIMHYKWNEFSKFPGLRRTIRAKNGEDFGQRNHISVQDAIQINRYYGCKNK